VLAFAQQHGYQSAHRELPYDLNAWSSGREQYLAFPAALGVEQDGVGAAHLFVHGLRLMQLGDSG
jgi:hypothetical protein